MGCGSSTATSTVSQQPAPKLKRIKEEDESASQRTPKRKSSSRSTINESNGHAKGITENGEHGEDSFCKQTRKAVTPPSSANGHVPRDSLKESSNNNGDSESTSGEQIIEDAGIDSPDTTEPSPAEENSNSRVDNPALADDLTKFKDSVSSGHENQSIKVESQKEGVRTSDGSASQSKITVDVEKANVTSSATVGERDVPDAGGNEQTSEAIEEDVEENKDASAGDGAGGVTTEIDAAQQGAASEGSFSGEKEKTVFAASDQSGTVGVTADTAVAETNIPQQRVVSELSLPDENEAGALQDQPQSVSGSAPDKKSAAAEIDLAQQRVVSDVNLPGEIGTAPEVNQTKRVSTATSNQFAAPSDNDVNPSPQESDSVSPATTERAQPSELREVTKEDPPSVGGEESPNHQNLGQDSVSAPLDVTKAREDSALHKKDTVDPLAESTDDFLLKSDSIYGRICTLSASVLIGSLDDPQGERTVTLTGSVYRVPRIDGGATTPKPGEKIGIVKGEVTSTPVDNESSTNLATLRGDLLAVSEEAVSQGRVATASIDVLSCATGEKIATITADVAPNDDSESAAGVISGEVLGASENGSHDKKIGTLAGKVVALTFDDDVASVCSADEERLKLRRESCFY